VNDKQRNRLMKKGRKYDALLAEKAASDVALAVALAEVEALRRSQGELRERYLELSDLAESRRQAWVVAEDKVAHLDAVNKDLALGLETRGKRIRELEESHEDTASLRRRLRAKTEEIKKLRRKLSQQVAQKYAGVCGLGYSLDHDIASDGTVTPSLVCPTIGCTWHVNARLEGWGAS
jgi:predicted RNase H-like nuclease (RuvC/YqgF family)